MKYDPFMRCARCGHPIQKHARSSPRVCYDLGVDDDTYERCDCPEFIRPSQEES